MKTSVTPLSPRWVLPLLLVSFVLSAATAPGQAQTPWKFVVIGDTRGTSSSAQINTPILKELAQEIVAQDPAFVIASGDLVYSGNLSAFQSWKSLMAPVYLAGIEVFPVIGNHDLADVNAFIQVFGADVPDNGPLAEKHRTYAFTYDNALVLGLDTYAKPGQVNQPWIDGILAANALPHVFSFGHMPAFKANHTDCLDDYPTKRDAFWTSLQDAGSRAYFCGHDHFYDHMRVDDGDGNFDNDMHQLIVGGGGAPLTTNHEYNGANTIWTPVPVYHEMQYGYAVVEVDGPKVTMTYHHRTRANTYVATSEVWSYTVSAGPVPPPAPTGLFAQAGIAQVDLSWQASPGATSYNLKRATGSQDGSYVTIASGLTLTSYTDGNVVNGTTYYYVVTAVNAVGESGNSAYVGATPKAPPSAPAAPATLSAISTKKGQIKLTWAASAGALSYNVKWATANGGPYVLAKSGVTATSYTDTGLVAGRTYYYVVTAVNGSGESGNSPQASAKAK